MEKNKQAWYCYGNRTNSYLLINYGFCFPDNLYNSFKLEIKVCLDYSLYSSENQISFIDAHTKQLINLHTNVFTIKVQANSAI